MFRLLIDTSVWLDLAKDYREQPVIGALEALIAAGEIELIVPQIVVDEFNRNKARIIDESRRSLQSHFRLVREAVNRFGTDDYRAGLPSQPAPSSSNASRIALLRALRVTIAPGIASVTPS